MVECGSVRLESYTRNGQRIINGFFFRGELFGADGIGGGVFPADAFAIEETRLCLSPLDELEALCREVPQLQHRLFGVLSNELKTARYDCTALRHLPAVDRTLAFLCNLDERLNHPHGATSEFALPMQKNDIAAYLGLTPETVSRCLRKLDDRGVIENKHHRITIRRDAAKNCL